MHPSVAVHSANAQRTSPPVPVSHVYDALAATVLVRVSSGHATEVASGFLLRLPCGPCLVTAAHLLKGAPMVDNGVSASRRADYKKWVGDRVSGSTGGRAGVTFVATPFRFWRHDSVLDIVVVAVGASPTPMTDSANLARQQQKLGELAIPLDRCACISEVSHRAYRSQPKISDPEVAYDIIGHLRWTIVP
jgi:hypothetical protein